MTELSRRSAIKTGLIAAVAAGASAGSVTAGAATKNPKMVYDVVVVGSGCAGMAAAIEAKRKGYNVAFLTRCLVLPAIRLCRRHYQRRRPLTCRNGTASKMI